MVLIGVGIFLLHFCIVKICKDRGFSLKIAILLMVVLDLSFMVYSIANVSFRIVPAILGTGVVALLFTIDNIKNKKTVKWIVCIVVISYILMLIHSVSSAYALLCYILLGVLWSLIGAENVDCKKVLIRFCCISIFFVIVTVCIVGLNQVADEKINGKEFIEYNAARGQYMDYG